MEKQVQYLLLCVQVKAKCASYEGWEPPLAVYPRGQGDIPQHL